MTDEDDVPAPPPHPPSEFDRPERVDGKPPPEAAAAGTGCDEEGVHSPEIKDGEVEVKEELGLGILDSKGGGGGGGEDGDVTGVEYLEGAEAVGLADDEWGKMMGEGCGVGAEVAGVQKVGGKTCSFPPLAESMEGKKVDEVEDAEVEPGSCRSLMGSGSLDSSSMEEENVEEGRDLLVGCEQGMVFSPLAAETLEGEKVDVAEGPEVEPMSYSSLPGSLCSFSKERDDVDVRKDLLVGCTERVVSNPPIVETLWEKKVDQAEGPKLEPLSCSSSSIGKDNDDEGKDILVGCTKGVDNTKGAEVEPASYMSMPGSLDSSNLEKKNVDETQQLDSMLIDDVPVVAGCNMEVRISSSHFNIKKEVGVENMGILEDIEKEMGIGELDSMVLHDVDRSLVGSLGEVPTNGEKECDYGSQQVKCSDMDDKSTHMDVTRISSPHFDVKEEVEVGNMGILEDIETDMGIGELDTMVLRDVDRSLVGSLGAFPTDGEKECDYGSQQVKCLDMDESSHMNITPQSDFTEGTDGGEVEAKMRGCETMSVHDVEDSKSFASSFTLNSGVEDASAFAPFPAAATDVMVEDMAMADEKELSTDVSIRGGRKKRGRPSRIQASKSQSKKKVEEDLCFICFDGGDLVVCDRRGCPKVYHPSCVNRDEAFFRAKGRWNCGWHICSICEKSAHFMCYTCTYSLCKGCVKGTEFICVRGNKGLCETCRGTVMLIETNGQSNMTTVNFDDKSSWEFLFKDYWFDLKAKLSITLEEITQAKNPSKRSLVLNEQSSDEVFEANDVAAGSSSDSNCGKHVRTSSTKKRARKKAVAASNEKTSINTTDNVGSSMPREGEWASKELLEFISHMRSGDTSSLSQFDVQALLLEYIKSNSLRDPRRKSQIICDLRLKSLFGKARVGHFEMLKLLESHFLIKEHSHAAAEDDQGAVHDTDGGQVDLEGSSDAARRKTDKKRKVRRKEGREPHNNFNDYAAVDVHNISLVYLRRNLMEDLIEDVENFHQKVVDAFVRIRISGTGQKQDMYRIVQVVGTSKAAEKYKTRKKTTDITLEVLNLNKIENIPIDSISNQEFTEEECKRLRQSIKCGLIRPMTVGDLQEKAISLQAIRVNDWLESEKLRLGHLRDRASEKGHRKELRECVEKLQLLNTPEERTRRLNETLEIHADPNMDPAYESAEEESVDKKSDNFNSRSRDSGRKGRESMSYGKNLASFDAWNGGKTSPFATSEPGKNVTRDAYIYTGDRSYEFVDTSTNVPRALNTWSSNQTVGTGQSAISPSTPTSAKTEVSSLSNINESEKIWHYQDPSGKTQGPFSIVQLRKWNTTGYFPHDLKIWKSSENQENSLLLTDVLAGKIQRELPKAVIAAQSSTAFSAASLKQGNVLSAVSYPANPAYHPNTHGSHLSTSGEAWKVQLPNGTLHDSENNSHSLPTLSPIAGQPMAARWDANSSQNVNLNWSSPAAFEPGSTTTSSVDQLNASASGWASNLATCQNQCPSPTPNNEQAKNFDEHQKSHASSISQNERVTDTATVSTSAFISNTIPVPGNGITTMPTGEWSMPSPTPSTNSLGLGPCPKVSQAHIQASVRQQTNPSTETMSRSIADQTMVSNVQQDAGVTQTNPNIGWGAVQGTPNITWGPTPQGNTSLGWVNPAQGNPNVSMGWGSAAQGNPTAGMVWRGAGQVNAGWGPVAHGNPNQNVGWGTVIPVNPNLNGNWAAPTHGYPNVNLNWVAPTQENAGTGGSWAAPMHLNMNTNTQGASNVNTSYLSGNGNVNTIWNPQNGNYSNNRGTQNKEDRNRHSGHGDRSFQAKEAGHGGGRQRMQPSSGGYSRPSEGSQRVCKYYSETGHCRRGSSCSFLHT